MTRLTQYAACLLVLLSLPPLTSTGAQGNGWHADVKKVATPGRPAAGRIHGKPFRVDRAELGGGILTLRQGKEFFADREFKIFLFAQGEKLDGKTFQLYPTSSDGQNPHVHMSWMEGKGGIPRSEVLLDKYTLRLQFGKRKKNGITGQIYLCMPDPQKSYVAGYFTATFKE